jgi:CRP-like cAMP-binding protein
MHAALYEAGQPPAALLLIMEGTCKVTWPVPAARAAPRAAAAAAGAASRRRQPAEVEVAILGPGDVAGEAAVLQDPPCRHASSVRVASVGAALLRLEARDLRIFHSQDLARLRQRLARREARREAAAAAAAAVSEGLIPQLEAHMREATGGGVLQEEGASSTVSAAEPSPRPLSSPGLATWRSATPAAATLCGRLASVTGASPAAAATAGEPAWVRASSHSCKDWAPVAGGALRGSRFCGRRRSCQAASAASLLPVNAAAAAAGQPEMVQTAASEAIEAAASCLTAGRKPSPCAHSSSSSAPCPVNWRGARPLTAGPRRVGRGPGGSPGAAEPAGVIVLVDADAWTATTAATEAAAWELAAHRPGTADARTPSSCRGASGGAGAADALRPGHCSSATAPFKPSRSNRRAAAAPPAESGAARRSGEGAVETRRPAWSAPLCRRLRQQSAQKRPDQQRRQQRQEQQQHQEETSAGAAPIVLQRPLVPPLALGRLAPGTPRHASSRSAAWGRAAASARAAASRDGPAVREAATGGSASWRPSASAAALMAEVMQESLRATGRGALGSLQSRMPTHFRDEAGGARNGSLAGAGVSAAPAGAATSRGVGGATLAGLQPPAGQAPAGCCSCREAAAAAGIGELEGRSCVRVERAPAVSSRARGSRR